MKTHQYLWFGLLIIIGIVFLRIIYTSLENNEVDYITSTQKHLDEEVKKVRENEAGVIAYLSDHPDFEFQELNKLKSAYPFYLFKNNQLVYWSDDRVIPQVDRSLREGWQFQSRKSGEFLYLVRRSLESNITLIFVLPLHQNYDINNDYIQPSFNTEIFKQSDISLRKSKLSNSFPLYNNAGEVLFYINLKKEFKNHKEWLHILIISLEILSVILLIIWLWQFSANRSAKGNYQPLLFFIVGLTLIRFLMWMLNVPFQSEEMDLFNPKYFASSILNSSFGTLILNTIFLFVVVYFIINQCRLLTHKHLIQYHIVRSALFQFITYGIVLLIYGFIELIYRHSQWGLDITNSVDLNVFKFLTFAGVIIYGLIIFHVLRWVHQWNSSFITGPKVFLRDQSLGILLFILLCLKINAPFVWVTVIVLVLNSVVYYWHLAHSLLKLSFLSFIYLFLLVSAISLVSSWAVLYMENVIERNNLNSLGNRIMNDNDVLAEYSLSQIDASLKQDQFIRKQFLLPITPYKSVVDKIEKYYLNNDYFDKYEKKITIYDASGQSLYPANSASFSASYPVDQLSNRNSRSDINLFLVGTNEGSQIKNKYIYLLEIKIGNYVLATIVLELKLKKIRPDNVFPELLVDKRFVPTVSEIPYDYALYKNDTLAYSVGNLNFPRTIESKTSALDETFQDMERERKLKLTILEDGSEVLVFSAVDQSMFRFFSNFSFFFILCFTIIFTFSVFYFIRAQWQANTVGLGAKIQLYFSLAFLVPLISVSVSTVSFVNATFLQDIVTSYQDRTRRVAEQMTDLIMKFNRGEVDRESFNSELVTITKVVNSDMNIYGLNGKLLVTSQPQIFEKKILSEYVNPNAFAAIKFGEKKMVTLEETIGKLNYQSAYIGIRSYDSGDLLAILASPFFKSNKEYDALLTDLLTNVFNIFVASFIIFMFLAYAATKILTDPLNLLKEKLAQVNLAANNEPLVWKVDDEIGLLISEYNDMLLKLEKSRLALSRTEKESAWREMAQQVAHEIKNPLTPMKLSLQHLQMRLENSDNPMPEASAKIKAILSQVDNLSDIATSFSSFAKMPIPDNEKVCVSEILTRVVSFFQAQHNQIELNLPEENIFAWVDKKIIERIFNNMIINALQSKPDTDAAKVRIELSWTEDKVLISIADNGIGIPEENHQKVFLPNFTTKETGSGIGLAIAKRGVEHAGGKIWFESSVDEGTTFYLELKYME
ncbi:HAMP domain-containing histidine kinase [Marivirga sp. S37H4]|uniref:histidine kinase n=1 Tax=Marivirga aurantiaca TaxID=2802615 RepID=A0A935C598_9BACT|nr:HAMP domain-containing sensor histidine kinase [Marivirga aurantiaca]MBK6263726.1 HAMP domain-containing histidine kinase [Marivirga aurantiaca]